jgi:lia operon protein LiaG
MKNFSILGVVLIVVLVWGALTMWDSGKGFAWGWLSFGTNKVDMAESFDAGRYRNVGIEVGSSDVNVVRGSTDKIEVRLHGKTDKGNAGKIGLKTDSKGDTLNLGIEKPEGMQLGFRIVSLTMTVELPEKQWNELKVKAGSGDVEVAEFEGTFIEAEASSGNVELSASNAKKIALKTGSGDVKASDFKADTVSFDSRSGNVVLKDGEAELKGETGSGDIRIEMDELLHDTDVSAGSGNVTIGLDREPKSLTVDYRGKSGDGKIRWKGFDYQEKDEEGHTIKGAFGSGGTKLKVATGSGNFTLD